MKLHKSLWLVELICKRCFRTMNRTLDNKNNFRNASINYFQKGLTLIELLVSMLIASIVFGGVVAVVQTSRSNHASEQESSLMQESTRFAIELLSRDIRMAGALGCAERQSTALGNVLGQTPAEESSDDEDDEDSNEAETRSNLGGLVDNSRAIGITGYEGAVQDFPVAVIQSEENSSDAIILRYANPDPRMMAVVESHVGQSITTQGSHNFKTGDKIAVVDKGCRQAGIFQNTSTTQGTVAHSETTGGYPGNCSGHLYTNDSFNCSTTASKSSSSKFKRGSLLYPYVAHAYYIDQSNIVTGMPALKRTVMNSTGARPEELAQGVESLNFEYGVDDDDDGRIDDDTYVTAENVEDWENVVSVKFYMILRSQNEVLAEPRDVPGEDGVQDRYLRQEVSGTIALRNS